jgi:ariadne-1
MIPDCCGHAICRECYSGYVLSKMSDGQDCVFAKCPDVNCAMILPPEIFLELLPEDMIEKFLYFCCKSYISLTKTAVWCPTNNCEKICLRKTSNCPKDVQCGECTAQFCFICLKPAHQPINCEMLEKWLSIS